MKKEALALYFQKRIAILLGLGLLSGLPLALTASTLAIWLTEQGITKATIGIFASVALPYSIKFLWAPLTDNLRIPMLTRLLGRRRSWLLVTQGLLAAAIMLLGSSDPKIAVAYTAAAAFFVALFSATQDIILDACRVEMLDPEEQGAGSGIFVLGYRLGMIISSAGALYLAAYYGWQATYMTMAILIVLGMLLTLAMQEPTRAKENEISELNYAAQPQAWYRWLTNAVFEPFADFMTRKHWGAILLFVLLYKMGDAFMGVMTSPFYIETGFNKEQIAYVAKLYGLIATIAGGLIGGWIVYRAGLIRSLWICGFLQAVTNIMYVFQAHAGADVDFLKLTIGLDNLSGGMGTSAFVAYMGSLCNVRFTATQYALLSSLAAFGRTILSTPAGYAAERLGWDGFFILSMVMAIPGLLLLFYLQRSITPISPPAAGSLK